MSKHVLMAAACLLMSLLIVSPSRAADPAGGFEHFITRDGDVLKDGDQVYRFIGVNMPGLNLPYDYFYGIDERMILPTPWEQEDGFKTMQRMGVTCVRTWNLSIAAPGEKNAERFKCVLGPGQFNEKAFVAMDHMMALANKYQVRVIFSLTADHGDFLGGVGEYTAHRGKPRKAFFTDPQLKDDYKATVKHVLTRRNTVTGVRYADDKAILAWQFGNEMERTRPGEEIQRAWQAEMAAYMKSLDPNHLVAYGRRFFPDKPDPNIDIVDYHYYGGDWLQKIKDHLAKTKGKRPFLIGEFGLESNPKKVDEFLDAVVDSDVAGAMIWSMYFHHRDGGFWHHGIITQEGAKSYHWPGFETGAKVHEREIMQSMREHAFAIRGMKTPPIQAPEAPQMLPFDDMALFSWRGAAGASSYIIQRAPKAAGPWNTIAENVIDSTPCYRPLFADAAARPGQSWCYRVIAVNTGGRSEPSNVIGPVKIQHAVLADEMKTLDLAAAHSPGLKAVDKDNYHFAEHFYRAEGKAGDWLTYAAPEGLTLSTFDISVWNCPETPGLRVLVSADGENWRDVTPEPTVRHLTPYYPHGKWKNMKASEQRLQSTDMPSGMRQIKLQWPADAMLDRVELSFR
ncbi:hypothetical protein HED60_06320 [Planctomycetales bacterium ZRK34]|nr:hypothetical protein HED60_06320 [Planctomycetales bacterium ZRK34]